MGLQLSHSRSRWYWSRSWIHWILDYIKETYPKVRNMCCFLVVCNGSWWIVMIWDGLWWFVMVLDGFWLWFMIIHGSFTPKFSRKRPCNPHLTNQSHKFTIKPHFGWGLLFAPFHLKSTTLKSSVKNWDGNLRIFGSILHECIMFYWVKGTNKIPFSFHPKQNYALG